MKFKLRKIKVKDEETMNAFEQWYNQEILDTKYKNDIEIEKLKAFRGYLLKEIKRT